MHCTTCGQPLADGARFCIGCGSPATPEVAAAPVFCTGCGASLPQGGQFCPTCGHPSVPPAANASMGQQQWTGGTGAYPPQQQAGAWATATAFLSNKGWAQLVVCALVIVIIVDVVAIFSEFARLDLLSRVISGDYVPQSELESNDSQMATIGLIQFVFLLGTAALFLTWLFRAYKNLLAFNVRGLRFSPGWAIGGWFVPFLNLWRPHEVVREIWRASSPRVPVTDERAWQSEPVSPVVGWWWGAWIIGNVIGWLLIRMVFTEQDAETLRVQTIFYLISDGLDILAAVLLMSVVMQITGRQEEKNRLLGGETVGAGAAAPVLETPIETRLQTEQPASAADAPLSSNAAAQRLEISTDAPSPPNTTVAASPAIPGYCEVCGQELGVNEKLRGLNVHERCAVPTPEAIAAPPVSELPEARPEAIASPVPAPAPGPKTPGRCDLCGEELGVNEKLRGLATHEKCPVPVAETRTASPVQASQVYCTECGTPMPSSSSFCHKCGSAVAAAD